MTMSGVQRAAQSIVVEVAASSANSGASWRARPIRLRRMRGSAPAALHDDRPSLLAVIVPIITGLILGAEGR